MQSLPLWPIPFYTFTWADHEQHANQLKTICHELESQNKFSNVTAEVKQNLYESTFDFAEYPNASVRAWADWTKDCFFKASSQANKPYWPPGLNIEIQLHESWCHITRDGGYHDMHIHANSSWSCIYYLDIGNTNVENKNGVNRFYNPNSTCYNDAGTVYLSQSASIDISPRNGMLVVFPSWLQHSALLYRGTQPRYILSANSRITVST